jgi:hypothetical protein
VILGALIIGGVCLFVGSAAITGIKEAVTKQTTPELVEGNTYWIKAPLVFHDVSLYTKPKKGILDTEPVICGVLDNATEVKLVGKEGDWCYIEGVGSFGTRQEGWVDCIVLLNYQPTPLPTPNLTPQHP